MTPADDRIVLGVIERSAIVQAVERVATRLGRAAGTSRTLQATRTITRAAQRNFGVTILAAVAVHIALVGVVVRPVSWYWLIIPALFAAAGALLVALPRVDGRRGA
jgi:hypothetical protein